MNETFKTIHEEDEEKSVQSCSHYMDHGGGTLDSDPCEYLGIEVS